VMLIPSASFKASEVDTLRGIGREVPQSRWSFGIDMLHRASS
jgi:hypothetical protein